MMSEVQLVWEIPALLGEGPVWVEAENAVYWVDIFNNNVHRYGLADGAKTTWTFDFAVTSLNPRAGGGFVGTIEDGYASLNFDVLSAQPIALPEADQPNNRFNDGKVDSSGRYWAGTMDIGQVDASGALYRLDPDLRASRSMPITSFAMDRPSTSTTASFITPTASSARSTRWISAPMAR